MTLDNSKFKLLEVLAIAVSIIERDGEFLGNSNTGYPGDTPGYQSTKDKVLKFLRKFEGPEVTAEHHAKAKIIIEYFSAYKSANISDFLHTIIDMCKDDIIPLNKVGYAVAMVPTFNKFQQDEEFFKKSDYVGVVGKRQNFFIKLFAEKYIRGAECYLYTFIDRRQNVIKTWVTMDKKQAFNIEVGDCVDLDAYVAKHEANKHTAVRETYINRIKIIENKGKA